MTGASPGDEPSGESAAALEEWVSETATRKGLSERELLDEVLSSYWILEELSEIVETTDSPGENAPPSERTSGHGGGADPVDGAETRDDSLSELESELQRLREAIEESTILDSDGRDHGERSSETRHQSGAGAATTRDDFEWVEPSTSTSARASTTPSEGRFEAHSVSSPERRRTGPHLQTRVEDVETTLQNLFDLVAEISTDLDSVLGRGEPSRDRSGDAPSVPELERRLEEARQDHQEFEREMEREFDSIENVLEHLLTTTENLSYRVDTAVDSLQDDVATIKERLAERDRLAALKAEANREDVDSAVCDHCGQSITIPLLEAPRCPACEREFTDLEPGGWLPFRSAALETRMVRPRHAHDEKTESVEEDVERLGSGVDGRH